MITEVDRFKGSACANRLQASKLLYGLGDEAEEAEVVLISAHRALDGLTTCQHASCHSTALELIHRCTDWFLEQRCRHTYATQRHSLAVAIDSAGDVARRGFRIARASYLYVLARRLREVREFGMDACT